MEKERIIDFAIYIGAIIAFTAIGMIIIELHQASHYCHTQDGKYKLSINEEGIIHLCDGSKISRYFDNNKTIWDFEENRNFTINLSKLSPLS